MASGKPYVAFRHRGVFEAGIRLRVLKGVDALRVANSKQRN
jgi:hypothetical protein